MSGSVSTSTRKASRVWATVPAAFPSLEDRDYVRSSMVGETEPGKCANWTIMSDRGIDNQLADFEYVRRA
ncbi:hypothetical protein [Aurantiacibacter sediminis]|nr:hypothetical protein [Aurantiacibacter sediminis]